MDSQQSRDLVGGDCDLRADPGAVHKLIIRTGFTGGALRA